MIAFVISLVCLARMEVFQSTALLLIGQLLAGILFDVVVYRNFTLLKLAGIIMVASGIILDKKITSGHTSDLR